MNRALLIVMVPALLVAAGYVFVLRTMGFAPGYPRLIVAMAAFFAAIYLMSRRQKPKAETSQGRAAK
jgi:ABC-type spermidine/putrescine transport system permease subunit II